MTKDVKITNTLKDAFDKALIKEASAKDTSRKKTVAPKSK